MTAMTVDKVEVQQFSEKASEWWKADGAFATLHAIGPTRLTYIRQSMLGHFGRNVRDVRPFSGLSLVDIGCGGGLVSEPLARLGAAVTAIDPGEENIAAARAHAAAQGLAIDYRACTSEELAAEGRQFDGVVALEVLEHVPDVGAFLRSCAALLRPGGLLLVSTINRTAKSYALMIVGAEYVLRWVPRGTHRWDRFITPAELDDAFRSAGLSPGGHCGMALNPLTGAWGLSDGDLDVNYFACATRPGSPAAQGA
jgi:2-polyprenyl-6-hydroxyphenyl methylase/3-demethylubiquinone-9 3-methyltransferase